MMLSTAFNVVNVNSNEKKDAGRRRNQRAAKKRIVVRELKKEKGFVVEENLQKLSPEEQKEHSWKQSQRRLNEPVKIIPYSVLEKITRRTIPDRKLADPNYDLIRIVPLQAEDPSPVYVKEAIRDTNIRGVLDIGCMKERIFKLALEEDIKERMVKISTETEKKKGKTFINITQKDSDVTLLLSDGLLPSVFPKDKDMKNRILCISALKLDEVKEKLIQRYPSFMGIRRANAMDVSMIVKQLVPNAYEAIFGKSEDGQRFCEDNEEEKDFDLVTKYIEEQGGAKEDNCYSVNALGYRVPSQQRRVKHAEADGAIEGKKEKDFTLVMRYPEELDDVKEQNFYSVKAHWYPTPSKQKPLIYVKNAEDVGHAKEVLDAHGMKVEIVNKFEERGSKCLAADWTDRHDEFTHDRVLLEMVVKKIFDMNEIEFDDVRLKRHSRSYHNGEILEKLNSEAEIAVNDRLLKINKKVTYKTTIDEPTDCGDRWFEDENEAYISFDDHDLGEWLVSIMAYTRPKMDKNDNRGIEFDSVYTVPILVPGGVRVALHKALDKLDTELRETSIVSTCAYTANWARLRDDRGEQLLVQGWPQEKVKEAAERVKEILKPKIIDCKDDQTHRSPTKLLYGCGLALVNKLQKDYIGKVMMSIDRLNEKIHLWGDGVHCDSVFNAMQLFLLDPRKHLVSAEIPIREPRFLPVYKEVLSYSGERTISDAVGGAEVKFMNPDKLVFKGSVAQFEYLQELLDEGHTNMVKMAQSSLKSGDIPSVLYRECPYCESTPTGGFTLSNCGHTYCLDCLTDMIRDAIDKKEIPLRCCSEDCNHLIAIQDIMALLFDETTKEYQKLFRERLEPLWKATREVAVRRNICPSDSSKGALSNGPPPGF